MLIYLTLLLLISNKYLKLVYKCGITKKDDNNENACLDFCKANFLGRPYAATNGDNCFCLSYKEYIDVEKGDKSKCNIKCKKKDSEFCGGNDAHSISPVCSCYKNVDDSRAGGRLILTDDKNMSIERCGFGSNDKEVNYELCDNLLQVMMSKYVVEKIHTTHINTLLMTLSFADMYGDLYRKYNKPGTKHDVWIGTLKGCAERHGIEFDFPTMKVEEFIMFYKPRYLPMIERVYMKDTMVIPRLFFIVKNEDLTSEEFTFWNVELGKFQNFEGWSLDVTIGDEQ
ncbi:hypothetical protein HDU92_003351 [Lobulomyces angularis]|nr:hypothetical protein HDU92_003351 [Lobulomyces angularis]